MQSEWFVKIVVQICNFRVSDSDLHFRDAEHPSKWPPGHSWLQKCICEERLSIENVTFWAPSIFQKLRVPDLRLADSVDSRSNLWSPMKKSMKIDGHQSKMDESWWINENQWESMKFLIPKQFIFFPDFAPNLSEAVRILVQAYVTRKCKFWHVVVTSRTQRSCCLCCGRAGRNGRDSPSQNTFQLR